MRTPPLLLALVGALALAASPAAAFDAYACADALGSQSCSGTPPHTPPNIPLYCTSQQINVLTYAHASAIACTG